MKTAQILKLALVAAILMALYKLLAARRRAAWNVQPYALERYGDDNEDYEDAEDEDAEDDNEDYEDAEDEDAEDDNEDYEDAEDEDAEDDNEDYEEDNEDYEEDNEDYEDDDEDDEDDDMEGYSNAAPTPGGWKSGVPLMNIATDLLPKPSGQVRQNFAEFAPKSLLGQNFLEAKKYIGVDTQGSSLRNANYDLRSSPAIARRDVGPWAQSTIDGDLFRKPLE